MDTRVGGRHGCPTTLTTLMVVLICAHARYSSSSPSPVVVRTNGTSSSYALLLALNRRVRAIANDTTLDQATITSSAPAIDVRSTDQSATSYDDTDDQWLEYTDMENTLEPPASLWVKVETALRVREPTLRDKVLVMRDNRDEEERNVMQVNDHGQNGPRRESIAVPLLVLAVFTALMVLVIVASKLAISRMHRRQEDTDSRKIARNEENEQQSSRVVSMSTAVQMGSEPSAPTTSRKHSPTLLSEKEEPSQCAPSLPTDEEDDDGFREVRTGD